MRVSQPRCKFVKQSEWFHCRQLSPEVGQGELSLSSTVGCGNISCSVSQNHMWASLFVRWRSAIPFAAQLQCQRISARFTFRVCVRVCVYVCEWSWVCLSCAFRELFLGGQSASKQSWQRDSEPAFYLCLSLDRQRSDMNMYIYHMWYHICMW